MADCASCGTTISEGSRLCTTCLELDVSSAQTKTRTQMSGLSSTGARSARFLPGAVYADRYRIVGPLGQGGMGEVYRADDLRLGQPVALKLLPLDLANRTERRERLLNEVKLARQVSHPNVCRVYDVGEADGQYFLSMEYVDGEDLASLLRRIGRLPGDKAVELARQLCAGLAAAHEQGILHRDLKPANVMLDGRGRARITDFGLAAAGPVSEKDIRVGTPAYMAPEQLEGREVTVRSDLYSLGLVLYELFTGRRGHEGTSREDVIRNRLQSHSTPTSPFDHLQGLDPAVEGAILRCLEHDPERRPATALAIAAALPGGDPLAEALAAGETPSPQMVAAAGKEGSLSLATAWILLIFVIAGLFLAVPALSRTKLVNRVSLEMPPVVLADTARRFIREMGYDDPVGDLAWGFQVNRDSIAWIREVDLSPDRWEHLSSGRPAALRFWYRESREPMGAWRGTWGSVTPEDPPLLSPGMLSVELDTLGRLLRFEAIPDERHPPPRSSAAPDWDSLLEMAEIDRSALEEAEPIWTPPVHSDARAAWNGVHPEYEDEMIRVEAASLLGRPVFFRIIEPWESRPAPATAPVPPSLRFSRILVAGFPFAVLVVGILLARRNIRLGRADRSAATKMATAVMLVHLIVWLAQTHYADSATGWISALESIIAETLYMAMTVWILYVALEPFVRRRWPEMLVSWNRLLGGALRDPLVGRDFLIGSLMALVLLILYSLQWSPLGLQGVPPDPETSPDRFLAGPFAALAEVLDLPLHVLFGMMQVFFLLVLIRVLLRQTWLAAVVFALLIGIMALSARQQFSVPFIGLMASLFVFVMIRYGFLAIATTAMLFALGSEAPMTTSISAWYGVAGTAVIVIMAAVAIYGFLATTAGRPLFGGILQD